MSKLIVGRHTETIFNYESIFSGCMDVPLSSNGINQALAMLDSIYAEDIDVVFSSKLLRTKETAAILMQAYYEAKKCRYPVFAGNFVENNDVEDKRYIPVFSDQRLNERSYGILEGLDKKQVEEEYGKQQLYAWRRGWSEAPEGGESLCNVCERVRQFLDEVIIPLLEKKKNVLIICHQNSMRAIKIIIDDIKQENVEHIEFKNGQFLSFNYYNGNLLSED